MKQLIKHIAIFASGAGSNAQKIIDHFKNSTRAKVGLIVCNKPDAGVLKIAVNENVPVLMIEKKLFDDSGYVKELKACQIDFIVLAGFLWKLPSILINAYNNKIVNLHPALLPSYGGKGMYGNAVHAAVLRAKKKKVELPFITWMTNMTTEKSFFKRHARLMKMRRWRALLKRFTILNIATIQNKLKNYWIKFRFFFHFPGTNSYKPHQYTIQNQR